MPVLLIGTLDTKGAEIAYVRDRLRAAGEDRLVEMDCHINDAAFASACAAKLLAMMSDAP